MHVRHPWRLAGIALAAVVVVVVALGLWLGIVVLRVDHNLTAAADEGARLETFAKAGDTQQTDASLAALQRETAAAASGTRSPIWGLATHLPAFGDDARGVRTVAEVTDSLSHGALPALARSLGRLHELTPKNGRFDLAALAALQGPVDRGHAALDRARTELAAQDPTGYIARLRVKYRELQGDVDSAASALDSAHTALRVLPAMLGAHGPQRYLLVLQNNAEIRATGGLPGAVAVLRTDHGRVRMTGQVAGNSFGETTAPVLPLTADERWLWGAKPGTYFLDANYSPDFPRVAALWRARWRQVYPDVDGVISLDPVTLSYMLGAVGPVTADGVTLTSANVVDQLLHGTYLRYPSDPAAQDVFFGKVARAVFAKVSNGSGSPEALLTALGRATGEHRVYLASFDARVQQALDGTTVAGALPTRPTVDPQVGVAVNDETGAKMSYYLRYHVAVDATSCLAGAQRLSGQMTVASQAPANAGTTLPEYVTGGGFYGVKPGNQLVMLDLIAPAGGTVGDVQVNGVAASPWNGSLDGRQVAQLWLTLKPGQSDTLTWLMNAGEHQTGPTDVTVTPSIVAGTQSSVAPSACS